MTTPRPALTICGTLLMALVGSSAHVAAQTSPPKLWTIYGFEGLNGVEPASGLVIDKGGVLYGITLVMGAYDQGVVYSLTPPASPGGAWTETVLYNFPEGGPSAGVAIGKDGVLYGTTGDTVYSLTPPTSPGGAWTEAVLYTFTPLGPYPQQTPTGVVIGSGGVLYGTTYGGGTSNDGTVFSLTPPTSPGGVWTETVLYNFLGGSDGALPVGVVIGKGGVLYGTTQSGGSGTCTGGCGTVFSLTPPTTPGGAWSEAVLHSFEGGSDGSLPLAGVVIGKGGVLYGTTEAEPDGAGTVFSLTPPATPGGEWTEAVLHNFGGPDDGAAPHAGVVIGSGGVLYGTTYSGGIPNNLGTVFSLTPPASPGAEWTEEVLHRFDYLDGESPNGGLVLGSDGVLYGTTFRGGPYGAGTVFALKP